MWHTHLCFGACVCVCVQPKVPEFDVPNGTGGGATLTIEPPLDTYRRGKYVASICAPMASKKSLRARIYAWAKKKGITVVIAGRISYGHNAAQEWRESAPGAKDQEAAAREALADYDELSEGDRRAAEVFGAGVEAPARVWCYLTHDKEQLAALLGGGFGVCIISPNFCSTFLSWLCETDATVDQLYVEEVMGLAQMWNTPVLRRQEPMYALRTLAKAHSRRVFGFCADFLMDERPAIFMNWCVPDRPHYCFQVPNAREHMSRKVCLFHGAEAAESESYEKHYDLLLACMVRYSDFRVWHTISYEKRCVAMYTRAVSLGIRSTLLIGNADGHDKLRIMTNFDGDCESNQTQALFATSVVTFGMNSQRTWNAVVANTGPMASGPIAHAQAAGRGGRVDGLEFDTILWLMVDSKPPLADEHLTSWQAAEKKHSAKALVKGRFAKSHRLRKESTPQPLQDLAILNEMERLNTLSHCALATRTVVEYKPGWTIIDSASITLSPRMAAIQSDVKQVLAGAQPLPDHLIQKVDSLPDEDKMRIGLSQLMTTAQARYEAGDSTYTEAVRDILDTCGGIFAHSHVSGTYQHGTLLDSNQVQMVRAWKTVRHFEKLDQWGPFQLLTFEKHERALNLAACHLGLGTRRVLLARKLLRAQSDQCDVGLYTCLPEQIDALEQACGLIGISCLAAQRIVLTAEDSLFVRLLQQDKMAVPSTEVNDALHGMRELVDVALGEGGRPSHGTKTLWDTLRSLLSCIHSKVAVTLDRRMNERERHEWEKCNDCDSDNVLAQATQTSGIRSIAELNDAFGFSSDEGEVDAGETSKAKSTDAAAASKAVTKKKPKAKVKKDGIDLRVPVTIEISRCHFFFDGEGRPVKASKAVKANARAVDVVPHWRIFSHSHGESVAARTLLSGQPSSTTVERELASLLPGPPVERFEVSQELRDTRVVAAATEHRSTVQRLTPRSDGDKVIVEEPIPAKALARELKRLRKEKSLAENRLCTPQLLEKYKKAKSKVEKKRLDREFNEAVQRGLGPKATAQLQWCEAVERKASHADADGYRWLLVEYRVKMGMGRQVASWPSLQQCEGDLRKEIMSHLMHDWDIVSCHFFLCEAVVRGLLGRDPEQVIPTIHRYNRACEEDVNTGRGKDENTFLKPIAEWYQLLVGEAKLGGLVLLNQGTTETWLQKEIDPPRDVPKEGHHDDMDGIKQDARTMRRLFFEHADRLFGADAFDAMKQKLLAKYPDDLSLRERSGMERSLFGYCLQQLEKVALDICLRESAELGLPPITRIYDGFGQLHVDGKDAGAFKQAAEAALRRHFKSPLYLTEKPFYTRPVQSDESESEDDEEEPVGQGTGAPTSSTGALPAEDFEQEDTTIGSNGHEGGGEAPSKEGDEEGGFEDIDDSEKESKSNSSDMEDDDEDVTDDGDGVAERGMDIDPNESRSEEEEGDSEDDEFLSKSGDSEGEGGSEEEALEDDDEGPVDSSDEEFAPKAKHTRTCVFQDDDSTDAASDGDAMEA